MKDWYDILIGILPKRKIYRFLLILFLLFIVIISFFAIFPDVKKTFYNNITDIFCSSNNRWDGYYTNVLELKEKSFQNTKLTLNKNREAEINLLKDVVYIYPDKYPIGKADTTYCALTFVYPLTKEQIIIIDATNSLDCWTISIRNANLITNKPNDINLLPNWIFKGVNIELIENKEPEDNPKYWRKEQTFPCNASMEDISIELNCFITHVKNYKDSIMNVKMK